ncbi:Ubiquitin-like-conjugating enzyme ATG10, partial [Stegodyphus mimosarum]
MTLTYEEFEKSAKDLSALSSSVGDEWLIRTLKNGTNENIYLEKKIIKPNNRVLQINDLDLNDIPLHSSFSVYRYYILYSHSYSVPVLYFNAYYENGKPLSLCEIWEQVPECYQDVMHEKKWQMVTEQEHPVSGIPCFIIHPCYTANLMDSLQTSNYIISWLSVFGPLVGLKLSFDYAKFTQ